jgi:hypothetical protein
MTVCVVILSIVMVSPKQGREKTQVVIMLCCAGRNINVHNDCKTLGLFSPPLLSFYYRHAGFFLEVAFVVNSDDFCHINALHF